MAKLGVGDFAYEVSGEDWGRLPHEWTYKDATAVAIDNRDNVYIFNRGPHPVLVFDRRGDFLRTWGEGVFSIPHGVTIGPDDTLFCIDAGDHTVRKFTLQGKLLMTIGVAGRPSDPMSGIPFNMPTDVAIDPRNGDFYVADGYSNAHIHKYSPDGKLLKTWGGSGTGPGEFNIPHNIAADKSGWVYVADRENHRVQVFDSSGKFETQWVNMSRPGCIFIDRSSHSLVYVGEYYCGDTTNTIGRGLGPRISIFGTSGSLVARLGEESFGDEPGRFYAPHGISVDSQGSIYVAEVSGAEFGYRMDPPRQPRSMQKLVKVSRTDAGENPSA